MRVSTATESFCRCFDTIQKSPRTPAPSMSDPLIVLLIFVPRTVSIRATPPAIKKILSDFVHFMRLATHVVAAVSATITISVLLNSNGVYVFTHPTRSNHPQKAMWSTVDASESCCFLVMRYEAVAMAPHEMSTA